MKIFWYLVLMTVALLFLTSCSSKEPILKFQEQYDYKVTNILLVGKESYQCKCQYIIDHHRQFKIDPLAI